MDIKQLRLTFLRTRILSKKCPKVTFWLEKTLTRTVSIESFWPKFRTFFKLCFQRSASFLLSFSCQNYGRRRYAGGNNEKLIKKLNKLQFDCDVINDVTLMSHRSSESPYSEVMTQ